jgi:integrase
MSLLQLDREIDRFLEFKRTLGHPYARGAFMLQSLRRYAETHARPRGRIHLEPVMRSWLARASGRKPVTITVELGVLRQFCLFRRRSDPCAVVPERDWAPQSAVSEFLPYIFSKDDIRLLLRSAAAWQSDPFRATTLRTLLVVLYCTGLRPGEAVRLNDEDIDFSQQCFHVRESKGKTRWVPFHDSLATILREYLQEREHVAQPNTGSFFMQSDGRGLSVDAAWRWMARLFRRCGFKPDSGREGPRPYDIRHTYAVHRLTEWYRAGIDIHARLPWLSAYMGHDDILGTEVYLTATPELLALASRRFVRRLHGRKSSHEPTIQ